MLLLRSLPQKFTAAEFRKKALSFEISHATGYRILKLFIREGLVIRLMRDRYEVSENVNIWYDPFPKEGADGPSEDH